MANKMKVLVACEYSGIVRDAFAKKGHDAWSCDILPTESPGNHFQGDVLKHLDKNWDLIIFILVCGCSLKDYDLNPGTTVFNQLMKGINGKNKPRSE